MCVRSGAVAIGGNAAELITNLFIREYEANHPSIFLLWKHLWFFKVMPIKKLPRCPGLIQHRSLNGLVLPLGRCPCPVRLTHNDASLTSKTLPIFPDRTEPKAVALARLPTTSILRSWILGAFYSSSLLFTPGFAFLKKISNSPSRLLNPDINPILRAIVKPLIYDQFCAGTNSAEIQAKISQIKSLGFSGVILCYSREHQASSSERRPNHNLDEAHTPLNEELKSWKRDNLDTLSMIGSGDFLGIKYESFSNNKKNFANTQSRQILWSWFVSDKQSRA